MPKAARGSMSLRTGCRQREHCLKEKRVQEMEHVGRGDLALIIDETKIVKRRDKDRRYAEMERMIDDVERDLVLGNQRLARGPSAH